MVPQNQKRLIVAAAALLSAMIPLFAQNNSAQTDSLVRLMNATTVEQLDSNGMMMRKAVNARFLHNGTYLICDTSLWNLDTKIINCQGNVQLIQGETVLTSDRLDYLIDNDLAQFRGAVVQLRNKKNNLLRTRVLDYNTKDSVAVFTGGASMRSEDGQIIESDNGTYSSSASFFRFFGNVNMFTDSVFVRTDSLDYDSDLEKAYFVSYIDFWKDDKMLSADGGWYERPKELFFFTANVHGLSQDQESWCDTLYYHKLPNNVEMFGGTQIQDTSRRVASVSDYLLYQDSLSRVTLNRRAALATWDKSAEKVDTTAEKVDTTYMGADSFVYETIPKCNIPSDELTASQARLEAVNGDPVTEYRRRAAAEAAKKAEEAKANDPNAPPKKQSAAKSGGKGAGGGSRQAGSNAAKGAPPAAPKPSPAAPLSPSEQQDSSAQDSVAVVAPKDSAAVADSIVEQKKDSTKIGFLYGLGDVRIYRSDMQVRCDSLRYCDLDSLARFYKEPVIWNEIRRQYSSDSLYTRISNGRLDRAILLSNAFIISREDSTHFDQIKSTDVMAYFDSTSALKRFDALGGVNGIFYLNEDSTIATVNKVEGKMLSATMKDGDVDMVYYYDAPKSNAYPVVQLSATEQQIKGFKWQPERRPVDRYAITDLTVRPSERSYYESRPTATFRQTDIYFPGYMKGVYDSIEKAKRRRSAAPPADSTAVDSLRLDALPKESLLQKGDSLAKMDSLSAAGAAALDSSKVSDEEYMTPRQLRRAMRIARRDARWAKLDARDAAKAQEKARKAAERKQRRLDKAAASRARQEAKDDALLKKFIEFYTKQKERDERKQQSEPAGERPQGAEAGGDLQTSTGTE